MHACVCVCVMWIAVMYELASLLHSCLCRHIAYRDRNNKYTLTLINCIQLKNDNGNNNNSNHDDNDSKKQYSNKTGHRTKSPGKKRTTEATKRTKYHWAPATGYAIICKLYSILQSHSTKCDRKEKNSIFLFHSVLCALLPLHTHNAMRPNTLTASRK